MDDERLETLQRRTVWYWAQPTNPVPYGQTLPLL